MNKNLSTKKNLQKIIDAYNYFIKGIDDIATKDETRAYGGVVRATKRPIVFQ